MTENLPVPTPELIDRTIREKRRLELDRDEVLWNACGRSGEFVAYSATLLEKVHTKGRAGHANREAAIGAAVTLGIEIGMALAKEGVR